jgi:putative peptidoglycan lipid II flippase
VLAPGFYARQDTRTPVRIGIVAMLANIALSLALVFPLKHVGLALAISLAAFLNAALLYRWLRKHDVYRPLPGWGLFLLRIGFASAVMGALLVWGAGDLGRWLAAPASERVVQLALWVVAGLAAYLGLILALGIRPSQMLLRKADGQHGHD